MIQVKRSVVSSIVSYLSFHNVDHRPKSFCDIVSEKCKPNNSLFFKISVTVCCRIDAEHVVAR